MSQSQMIKPADASGPAVFELVSDMEGLPYVPDELINEIASHLNQADISSLRAVNRRFMWAVEPEFMRAVAKGRTLYPKYDRMAHFLFLLGRFPLLAAYVHGICLVADGFKEHEYGYGWAWEDLAQGDKKEVTQEDQRIINRIDQDHINEVIMANIFVNGGVYRTMLGQILSRLTGLRKIAIRKLEVDEHIPGWSDTDKLKQLSFYRPGLNTKMVYYGDWQYDTTHLRVTIYKDEFGDVITEPGAGSQAGFVDDLNAAIATSGFNGQVVFAN